MANQNLIYNILKGKNTLTPEIEKTTKASKKLNDSINKFSTSFSGVRNTIAGVFVATGISGLIRESIQLQNALIGLRSVAGSFGLDVEKTTEAAKELASDGLIPLTNVTASLKNLIARGFNLEESIRLFNAFKDSAAFNRQGQLDLGEAIERTTQGIKSGLSTLTDNAGLTKNLSQVWKEYAASLGTTVGKLTEAQKRQAELTGFIKEAVPFQGDYNRLVDTFGGQVSKLTTNFRFLLAGLGDFITKSPEVIGFVDTLAKGVKVLSNAVSSTGKKSLEDYNAEIAETSAKLREAEKSFEGIKKRVQANGLFDKITGGFFANLDLGGASLEVKKLSNELIRLKQERDGLGAGPGGSDKQEEVDQAALDAERKKQEELLKIREEFALVEEERRLERESFLSTVEEERFRALEETLGRESAIRLQAAQNLADDEVSVAKSKLNIEKALIAQEIKADQERNKKKEQIRKQELADREKFLSVASTLAQSENKALAAIGKAAAITSIAIDTPAAVASSFKFGAKIGGPPLGFTFAGIAATAMAAQAARVAGIQGFQQGGILEGRTSSGDGTVFRGNDGEAILTKAQQNELLNIAKGREPAIQSDSGKVIDIRLELEGRELARVIRNLQTDGYLAV